MIVSQVMENASEREGEMMHPQFRIDLLHERQRQLELDVRRTYLLSKPARPAPIADGGVALRLCSVHDDAAIEQLADPFRPTAHLLPLMRLRASQLEQATGTRARLVGALSLHRGRA